MAKYKITDLLSVLSDYISQGQMYAEVSVCEADDELPESLSISGIDSDEYSVEDFIDSCEIPDEYFTEGGSYTFQPDEFCGLCFSFDDLVIIRGITDELLSVYHQTIKDPTTPKEDVRILKQRSVPIRNLQAKIAQYMKAFSPSDNA